MGRHSAPDDDAATDAPNGATNETATLTLTQRARPPIGRHAVDEDVESKFHVPDFTPDQQATLVIAINRARLEQEPEQDQRNAAAKRERTGATSPANRAVRRKQARWERGVRADLRLLRRNAAVRLQCAAVVVIAFGGYTAVMLELGRDRRSYLLCVWLPIVFTGVLVGACLDLAHRRAGKRSVKP